MKEFEDLLSYGKSPRGLVRGFVLNNPPAGGYSPICYGNSISRFVLRKVGTKTKAPPVS
jgi:hypothetical protein